LNTFTLVTRCEDSHTGAFVCSYENPERIRDVDWIFR